MSLDWDRIRGSVVGVRAGASNGTGWLAAESLIVTNVHVIGYAEEATVLTEKGDEFPARVVYVDARLDVAFLAPKRPIRAAPLPIAGQVPEVGEVVYAIGHPLGLAFSVTRGIVSATNRVVEGVAYVQTDAALNPGNSGGPLIDERGRAVGMSTWIRRGAQNLGFAVPVTTFLDTLVEHIRAKDLSSRQATYRCKTCDTPYEVGCERCLACGDALPYTAGRSVVLYERRYVEAERIVTRIIAQMGYVPTRVWVDRGKWRLPQPNGEVWIEIDEDGEHVGFSARIAKVPKHGHEAFYRFLLTFNDQASGACRSALVRDVVMLTYVEPTAFMSEKDVSVEVGRLLGLSVELRDILQSTFGAAPAPDEEET
jgi:serine protease Do